MGLFSFVDHGYLPPFACFVIPSSSYGEAVWCHSSLHYSASSLVVVRSLSAPCLGPIHKTTSVYPTPPCYSCSAKGRSIPETHWAHVTQCSPGWKPGPPPVFRKWYKLVGGLRTHGVKRIWGRVARKTVTTVTAKQHTGHAQHAHSTDHGFEPRSACHGAVAFRYSLPAYDGRTIQGTSPRQSWPWIARRSLAGPCRRPPTGDAPPTQQASASPAVGVAAVAAPHGRTVHLAGGRQ